MKILVKTERLLKRSPLWLVFLICVAFAACNDDDNNNNDDDSSDPTESTEVDNSDYTVGLILKTDDAYDAYTLFAPMGNGITYLLSNCGDVYYTWTSDYNPGHAVYLLENGYLLRTGDVGNTTFDAGGVGGIIEMFDSDGDVVWDYTISSTTECQHHDIEYLDNGNILIIAWDYKKASEARTAGKTDYSNDLWSEKIIEIKPNISAGTAEVVWEWYAWDHIIQDENSARSNYGNVEDYPELIDINFDYESDEEEDWLHFNAIDYNEDLDQIVLSSRSYSEFWIIDHSTTTEQAASHAGGDYGMGGDLLYRWGNPQTYGGDSDDQMLFNQHDARWIDDDYVDGGMISVFNNNAGDSYSTVDVINTNVAADGTYTMSDGSYLPTGFQWTYKASPSSDMYSPYISGAIRLANGNTLICVGKTGTFTEVDYDGNTVWEYTNPVYASGIYDQYETTSANLVFRAEKYAADYSGLSEYDLESQGNIEDGSDYTCTTEE